MNQQQANPAPSAVMALFVSWTAVGLPLAWGVFETLHKTLALFQ